MREVCDCGQCQLCVHREESRRSRNKLAVLKMTQDRFNAERTVYLADLKGISLSRYRDTSLDVLIRADSPRLTKVRHAGV